MLYEYAIEPDVLHSWDKCRLTLNLMGFQHGRAIAAYPSWKRWKKMVFEACSRNPGCGEVEFQRIYEKVCRWRIRDDGPHDFHARYVLTDRGGYRLDKGLDEEHGVTQPVALLAEQEWRRVREGFRGGNSFFDKTGEFRVTAGGSVGPRSAG